MGFWTSIIVQSEVMIWEIYARSFRFWQIRLQNFEILNDSCMMGYSYGGSRRGSMGSVETPFLPQIRPSIAHSISDFIWSTLGEGKGAQGAQTAPATTGARKLFVQADLYPFNQKHSGTWCFDPKPKTWIHLLQNNWKGPCKPEPNVTIS